MGCLIFQKAAVEIAKEFGYVEAANEIENLPPVPAVPLEPLCEWLGKYANPCKIGIRCYYDNDLDCMPTVECWRYVLKKWMEEVKRE